MANGQLSDPITVASSSTLSKDSAVPYDDREQEVLYAGLVAAISTTWISFEVSVRHVLSTLLLFFSSTLLLFFTSTLLHFFSSTLLLFFSSTKRCKMKKNDNGG